MSATRSQVIEYLRAKGKAGAKFSEIQRFVCNLNGLNYDEKVMAPVWNPRTREVEHRMRRRFRGYWCTNLCGLDSPYSKRIGILQAHCIKKANNHWMLKDFI